MLRLASSAPMVAAASATRGGAAAASVPVLAAVSAVAATAPRRSIGACCVSQYFEETEGGDTAFSMRGNHVKFGRGLLDEVGPDAVSLAEYGHSTKERGDGRVTVALFTDSSLTKLEKFADVKASLEAQPNVDVVVYDEVHVEPTDASFMHAIEFLKETPVDAVVSFGGGSVMDTAKAAILYACYPPPDGDFLHYINAPVGTGVQIPATAPMVPHIAIPTTSGTGSECTGFAVCKVLEHPTAPNSKTGIVSPAIIPALAIVDPTVTHTLPRNVLAASGFDVICHAIESYTARPFTSRAPGPQKHIRPLNQGANPFSDSSCLQALDATRQCFERALADDSDTEARELMMWAATLAGVGFGNAGVHLPHGLSYAVSGQVKEWRPAEGYPKDKPMVPHGMGVILCAPSAFRHTAHACPERHIDCAESLGVDTSGITRDAADEAAEVVSNELIRLIQAAHFPNGLGEVGFGDDDVDRLTSVCFQQKRVVDNAPYEQSKETLASMYRGAASYW